jgi:hypothetical protein
MRCATIFVLLLLVGCADGYSPARSEHAALPGIGDEFSLHVGESVSIDGTGLEVRFVEVSEDSRCPSNALILCVWIGDGAVVLDISSESAGSSRVTLHTTLDPKDVDAGSVVLSLIRLDPYPEDVGPIPSTEYAATFTTALP